jgi:hypothetical protein
MRVTGRSENITQQKKYYSCFHSAPPSSGLKCAQDEYQFGLMDQLQYEVRSYAGGERLGRQVGTAEGINEEPSAMFISEVCWSTTKETWVTFAEET